MNARFRAAHHALRFAVGLGVTFVAASFTCSCAASSAQQRFPPGRVPPWPCRLVVKPTLLNVVADGWERSATLRRQCEQLADAHAIVALEWGTSDSQTQAVTRMGHDASGALVATVSVPPVSGALELIAHELEHVLERTRGLDFAAESGRRGSGVWRAFVGFETQAAIDAGRQVGKEVRDARRPAR